MTMTKSPLSSEETADDAQTIRKCRRAMGASKLERLLWKTTTSTTNDDIDDIDDE
jgi:phosphopantetheine adenylyltransferase